MIIDVHSRDLTAYEALTEALGRETSMDDDLSNEPGGTVVAHYGRLYDYADAERFRTSGAWAGHIAEPALKHRFVSAPDGDRRDILHISARLHSLDRDLSYAEWSEIAHRIVRVTGIAPPGDDEACRWIAVQGQPGRLDVIATLIKNDGTWSTHPRRLRQALVTEAKSIETDLLLHSDRPQGASQQGPAPAREHSVPPRTPAATSPLAGILRQLAAEQSGPMAAVRRVVEEVGRQAAALPGNQVEAAASDLFWAARRLYVLQEHLGDIASRLLPPEPPAAKPPPFPVQASTASRTGGR
ncbi:relaxase/mobilization nuclease [Streptomyces sp. NPDC047014]|uniref:relaxase/mobilization nuclease n=1 Tax=Streptomyces sp. NPDC047014 TaxID=3155736 RepID=UPI0033E7F316